MGTFISRRKAKGGTVQGFLLFRSEGGAYIVVDEGEMEGGIGGVNGREVSRCSR
jgi:hypothetical protein